MKIQKGSIIDVVATSSKPDKSIFPQIENYIYQLGFIPRIAPDIVSDDVRFYANTDLYRATAFSKALEAKDSNIIWAIKGGFGATNLFNYLEGHIKDTDVVPHDIAQNKILIGFSDLTALHAYLIKNYDDAVVTLHADMLGRIVSGTVDEPSIEALEDILLGNAGDSIVYALDKISSDDVCDLSGRVFGGNFTIVSALCGTHDAIEPSGNFLFLEDTGEDPEQILRSLQTLQQNGTLNDVKAVIFGDFIADDPTKQDYFRDIFYSFIDTLTNLNDITSMPSFFIVEGIGHGSANYPLFLNSDASIYEEFGNYFLKIKNTVEVFDI